MYMVYFGDIEAVSEASRGTYGCLGISVAFKGYLGMSEGSWEQL